MKYTISEGGSLAQCSECGRYELRVTFEQGQHTCPPTQGDANE